MPVSRSRRRDPDHSGPSMAVAGVGAALLMIVCCAAPALIAAGALAGLGAWISSPWVISAAALLAVVAVTLVVRRRKHRAACCPPPSSPTPEHRDRTAGPSPAEGSHYQ